MDNSKGVVVITGCSGRIGSRLAKRLCTEYDIVGIDFRHTPKEHNLKEHFKCDLSSDQSVEECFNGIKARVGNHIVAFVHLAAYYSFTKGDPKAYDEITVQGTKRILDQLKKFQVEQFIFSSTILVHAPSGEHEKINEEWTIKPKWDYPLSKVKAKEVIHENRGNIPTVTLRIAGCYDDECHSIPLANQIKRIYEKQLEAHLFPGNIHHGSSFVHFDDVIDAIDLCIKKRKTLPEEFVVLLGEEVTFSYDALQREISTLLYGHPISTYRVPKWLAEVGAWVQNHIPFVHKSFIQPWMIPLADDEYDLDITRAKTVLNWIPHHNLKDTIPKMIDFLKKDPVNFYETNSLPMPHKVKKIEESQKK